MGRGKGKNWCGGEAVRKSFVRHANAQLRKLHPHEPPTAAATAGTATNLGLWGWHCTGLGTAVSTVQRLHNHVPE